MPRTTPQAGWTTAPGPGLEDGDCQGYTLPGGAAGSVQSNQGSSPWWGKVASRAAMTAWSTGDSGS